MGQKSMERYKAETMKKDCCAWGLPAALRATLPGYALFIVWFEGTKSFDIGNISTDPASLFSLCLMATDLLALIAIGCLYRKVVSLQGRKVILIAMAPLIAVSTAGLLAPALGSQLPMPLAAVLGMVMGLTRAVLTLAWMETFCRFGMRDACICFSSSTIVGATLAGALGTLAPGTAGVVAAAIAGIACSLLVPAVPSEQAPSCDGVSPGSYQQTVDHWSFPLQPCLLMGVFAVATLLVTNLAGTSSVNALPRWISSVIAALVLLVMVLRSFDQLDIRVLSSIALPLSCIGLLGALSVFRDASIPAVFSASLGYQCFSTFTYVLLFNISYRYGVNPLWLFGFSRAPRIAAAIAIPTLTGTSLLTAPSSAADAALATTLVVLVCASSLCTVGKSFDTTWGIKQRNNAGSSEMPAKQLSLEERCSRAAFVYSLTRREEEVLVLLLRGLNTPEIERELCISNGTARNHIQHVYKKLSVHSREELRERMAREARKP